MSLTVTKAQILLRQTQALLKEYERCVLLDIPNDTYVIDINSNHKKLIAFRNELDGQDELGDKENKFKTNFLEYLEVYKRANIGDEGIELNSFREESAFKTANKDEYVVDVEEGHFEPYKDFSNQELLTMQTQTIQDQDRNLDLLSQSVTSQKHMSIQIGDELDTHNELLTELDEDINNTDNNLNTGRNRLNRIDKAISSTRLWFIAALLFIVLLLIIKFL